jgi:hypothetical protein
MFTLMVSAAVTSCRSCESADVTQLLQLTFQIGHLFLPALQKLGLQERKITVINKKMEFLI